MNIESNMTELQQMPATIKIDLINWKQNVENGGRQLTKYARTLSKILINESLLINVNKKREFNNIERRLKRLFIKLDKYQSNMQEALDELEVIKERTECMWQRLRLWVGDSCIRNYCISWKLTTPKLLKFLEFVSKRYDYEWEVKEIVVLQLEKISACRDADQLLQTWRNCRHAGGYEFNHKLRKFCKTLGVHYFETLRRHGNWNVLTY